MKEFKISDLKAKNKNMKVIHLNIRSIAEEFTPLTIDVLPKSNLVKTGCFVDLDVKDAHKALKNKDNIEIYPGYKWNGASIPRVAWFTTGTPFHPDHLMASLFHDYLYDFGRGLGWTRKEADILYREILLACGVSKYNARKEYSGLRLFAKKKFKKLYSETEES